METSRSRINGWLIVLGVPVGLLFLALFIGRVFYIPYYVPSQSMEPTFQIGDQFLVDKNGGHPPSVGDIVVVRAKDHVRIVRVVALAGDRVEMRDGIPLVNGVAAHQRPDGETTVTSAEQTVTARRFIEQLPHERGTHRVLDTGYTEGDDIAPIVVPAARFFALGDNRDNAADSRFDDMQFGLGMPPVTDIIGKAVFVYGSRDRSRRWSRPQ